jgi:tetratricopeptide (TPR) repeat protein
MFVKNIKFILILFLIYQIPSISKSSSLNNLNSKNVSKYFSGIVAGENKDNSSALDFFNSSKILLNKHEPFIQRYVQTLILENKIPQAINVIKNSDNRNFFEADLLLVLDSLKKNDLSKAYSFFKKTKNFNGQDRLNPTIWESLNQFIYVFEAKDFLNNKKNFGKLSIISETFQNCYLGNKNTSSYFLKLINDPDGDYTRYIFFYLSYLIENNRIKEAKEITSNIEYINTTLLLSQGKSWIESENLEKLNEVFSCKNSSDIISEFLFLVSNLYSSQDNFEKSNFYLNLSYFLNPKFKFNLALVVENQFFNGEYLKAKKTLKNFKKNDDFYYWFRIKKEAQIIEKQRNKKESLNYIKAEFEKIKNPNKKILLDIANFYKNSKKYEEAIRYYSKIIDTFDSNSETKADILYRRGGSYERLKKFKEADKDLLQALEIVPDGAYVLNYLAYSWLEREYKIDEAIKMLEKAYSLKSNDPYIIDSIGWAYYLIDDFEKAEKFLKRAVELMPNDPIVSDHYGDILWKLDRKIQARYFWGNVLGMEDTEKEMIKKINIKMIKGIKKS